MSRLSWGDQGSRLYEAGLDRGVLYPPSGGGVSWSGLTSVDEGFSDDSTSPLYQDGIKYLDSVSFGNFSATLRAFTYPPEFSALQGLGSLGGGLYVDDQSEKTFGLSYRTLIGEADEGLDYGYKIHVVYNLTAVPQATSNETLSNSPSPKDFSWSIESVPQKISGYRPTSYIYFSSVELDPGQLQAVEDLLYGTPSVEPRLPSIEEFVSLLSP